MIGTRNILKLCQKYDCRLLFASTCCCYGNNDTHPSDETSPTCPTEPYAKSKKEPLAIIGFRGKRFKRDINNNITPYLSWNEESLVGTSSEETFLTGSGGILYPPNKEFDNLITNWNLANDLCPTSDDIYFWGVSHHFNIKRISLGFHFIQDIIELKKSPKLCEVNNSRVNNQNDIAIKKITRHFNI